MLASFGKRTFLSLIALLLTLQFSVSTYAINISMGKAIAPGLVPGSLKVDTVIFSATNEAGEVVGQYLLKRTSPKELAEYTPSKLEKYFQQLKASSAQLGRPEFYLKRFPLEVFKFFVALGALATKDLIFSYNSNPIIIEQFLTNQKDPIGQTGFMAFMATNSVVAEPLRAAISSPKLQVMIPYLGMSAGMAASNILHELHYINFDSMRECLKTLSTNKIACDKAFEEFIKRDAETRLEEWTPSWLAMMLSTVGAWGGELAISKTLMAAAASTRVTGNLVLGIHMAMLVTPGGLWVKGIKLATEIMRFAGWIWLEEKLNIPITLALRNAWDIGPKLTETHNELEALLDKKLQNNWQAEESKSEVYCDYVQGSGCQTIQSAPPMDFPEMVQRYSQLAKKWRDANMIGPLTAHNNWVTYLADLSQWYNGTKLVYSTIVSHVHDNKFKYYKNEAERKNKDNILDRTYPLWGVKPKGFNLDPVSPTADSNWSNMFSMPDAAEQAQLLSIQDQAKILQQKSTELKLNDYEKKIVAYFLKSWNSQKPDSVGRSLDYLNQILRVDLSSPSIQVSGEFKNLLMEIRKSLGDPRPMWQPLQGYVKYLESYFAKTANLPTVPSGTGYSIVEHLIMQMLIGARPQNGDKIVDKKRLSGFKSQFNPPAITDDVKFRSVLNKKFSEFSRNTPFAYDMFYEQEGSLVGGNNIPTTIIKELISRDVISAAGENKFSAWWNNTAEQEYIAAWSDFERRYEQIIQNLYTDLTRVKDSAWFGWMNRSDSPHGVLGSVSVEINLYLSLLEKMNDSQDIHIDTKDLRDTVFTGIKQITQMLSQINMKKSLALNGPEDTVDLSRTILTSNLPSDAYMSVVKQIQTKIEQSFAKVLPKNYASQPLGTDKIAIGLQEKSLRSIQTAMLKSLNDLETLALVINTASYQQNHDAKGNSKDSACEQYKQMSDKAKADPVIRNAFKKCL